MYELNKTIARTQFKSLLGQANHFLITVLVGLNGVRVGAIRKDEEFSTSWNPKDVERSVDRSRSFVLDMSLIRAIDAFDTYMMRCARKPFAIGDAQFISQLGGVGQSVLGRFRSYDQHLEQLNRGHFALLVHAIEWRNKRVHSLSANRVDAKIREMALKNSQFLAEGYSGLNVESFLANFEAGIAPTFKEAAAVIRLTHNAVEAMDAVLLKTLPIEKYLKDALLELLTEKQSIPLGAARKIWDSPKREAKVVRLLRLVGVNETEILHGREVPECFVSDLMKLKADDVERFLKT